MPARKFAGGKAAKVAKNRRRRASTLPATARGSKSGAGRSAGGRKVARKRY